MTEEIIELAIRTPKDGVQEAEFIEMKNAAVRTLVSIPGIGPEREFEPFVTIAARSNRVFVGMTRYASKWHTYRAMISPSFLWKLVPFMKAMTPVAGIFLRADDPGFDYLGFTGAQNITELALLKPKHGVTQETFLKERKAFLDALGAESGVVASYTFTVTGGFQATDALVHVTVYQSQAEFGRLTARVKEADYFQRFADFFEPVVICFCTTIK